MNSEFMLTQGAGQKLEFAVQRAGGTAADIDYLSTGDNFSAIRKLRTGKTTVVDAVRFAQPLAGSIVDRESNIHLLLLSNGLTPGEWKQKLGPSGRHILSEEAQWALPYASEAPTIGHAYHVVICPMSAISPGKRSPAKLQSMAKEKGWQKPHWEVACLIADEFTDEHLRALGIAHLLTMHEPVKDHHGVTFTLYLRHLSGGYARFDASRIDQDDGLVYAAGVAFVIP